MGADPVGGNAAEPDVAPRGRASGGPTSQPEAPRAHRVSVIVPCFDSASTLEASLDSALDQTLREIQVIAVDDGSTDATRTILQRYSARDPQRLLVLEQENAGPYVARNRAVAHARAPFLAFLDSDDLWEPPKLELQVELMESSPEVVLCHTGGRTITADGVPIRTFAPQPDYRGECFRSLLVRNRLATSSVMVRRTHFESVGGFDEDLPARGDWEMWTRLSREGPFAAIDAPLIRYRFHAGRMSTDIDRMRHHHLRVIEKHEQLYASVLPNLGAYIEESRFSAYMAYGGEYLTAGRLDRARADALRAIRLRPGDSRGWKLLAKSLAGSIRARRFVRRDPGSSRRASHHVTSG